MDDFSFKKANATSHVFYKREEIMHQKQLPTSTCISQEKRQPLLVEPGPPVPHSTPLVSTSKQDGFQLIGRFSASFIYHLDDAKTIKTYSPILVWSYLGGLTILGLGLGLHHFLIRKKEEKKRGKFLWHLDPLSTY